MCVCARVRACVCVCVCVMESLWWSSAVLICQSHLTHSTDIIYKLQNHTQNINETDFTKSLDVEIKILCTFCKISTMQLHALTFYPFLKIHRRQTYLKFSFYK